MIKKVIHNKLKKWHLRRYPTTTEYSLNLRNLYVFPSAMGWAFLFLAFITWLLGTNYQNNLILALAYTQISLLVLTIFHSHQNLSGINLRCIGVAEGFVGGRIDFAFVAITESPRGASYVCAQWKANSAVIWDCRMSKETTFSVSIKAQRRGLLKPGPLLIESTFPLGLVRCWTWLNIGESALIYPKPIKCSFPVVSMRGVLENETPSRRALSGEEFSGVRPYRAGDLPKTILWKQFARDQGLWSKEFEEPEQNQLWLRWEDFYRVDEELTLSYLCYWVIELEKLQRPYGIALPEFELEPDFGSDHYRKALRALAIYGMHRE